LRSAGGDAPVGIKGRFRETGICIPKYCYR
jgi:hypothetical protein